MVDEILNNPKNLDLSGNVSFLQYVSDFLRFVTPEQKYRITSYIRNDGSSHNRGLAVDIVPLDYSKNNFFDIVTKIFKNNKFFTIYFTYPTNIHLHINFTGSRKNGREIWENGNFLGVQTITNFKIDNNKFIYETEKREKFSI